MVQVEHTGDEFLFLGVRRGSFGCGGGGYLLYNIIIPGEEFSKCDLPAHKGHLYLKIKSCNLSIIMDSK